MFSKNLFTRLTQFLLIILPFYVLLSVFFSVKIGIPKAGFFIKELIIILLFISLVFEFIRNKKIPSFKMIDYLIFSYIFYGIIITLINGHGLNSIIYGGRYDFMFLIVFLIFKHGKQFIQLKIKKLLELFLISGGVSLLFSIMIKMSMGEKTLLAFGFTDYASNWTFSGGIPNYHGLENSGIKRFSGILDGPNAMAYFLILYSAIFINFIKNKIQFHSSLVLIFLFSLIIITYSRSALLGIFSAIGLLILLNLKKIYKKYKKQLFSTSIILIIFISLFGFVFQDKVKNIILRSSSTTGHFDRMEIGINRFKDNLMGTGLAEAGPGFRNVYPEKQTKKAEEYYIPESWFIQQLIEGGIIYFSLFLLIFLNIIIKLYKNNLGLFLGLIAILVMNIFLHIFEATYISILMFIFIGLLYNKK